MWCINRETGVKFDMTEEYYDKYFLNNPAMEKYAGKVERVTPKEIESPRLTLKELKKNAKEIGITGSDRMNKEELEQLLKEEA